MLMTPIVIYLHSLRLRHVLNLNNSLSLSSGHKSIYHTYVRDMIDMMHGTTYPTYVRMPEERKALTKNSSSQIDVFNFKHLVWMNLSINLLEVNRDQFKSNQIKSNQFKSIQNII